MSRDLKSRVKSQNIVANTYILINFVMFYQAKSVILLFMNPFVNAHHLHILKARLSVFNIQTGAGKRKVIVNYVMFISSVK